MLEITLDFLSSSIWLYVFTGLTLIAATITIASSLRVNNVRRKAAYVYKIMRVLKQSESSLQEKASKEMGSFNDADGNRVTIVITEFDLVHDAEEDNRRQENEGLEEATILGIYQRERGKSYFKAQLILLISIILCLVLNNLYPSVFNGWLLIALAVLYLLLVVNHQLLNYRIRNGLYGTNKYEAKEIINFVLEHSDKSDFTDGDGRKKLMPDIEVAQKIDEMSGQGVTA